MKKKLQCSFYISLLLSYLYNQIYLVFNIQNLRMSKKHKQNLINKSNQSTKTPKAYQQGQKVQLAKPPKRHQNKQKGKKKPLFKTCDLCCEAFRQKQMISLCDCEHLFCKNCLHRYCLQKIELAELLTCPQQNCSSKLNENGYAYSRIPLHLQQKYKRITRWKQMGDATYMRQCPKCQGSIELVSKTKLQCSSCKVNYCKQCHMVEHKGNCQSKFQNEHREYRQCPRCKIFIEKYEGCNHITCSCFHEFCYICLEDWRHKCQLANLPKQYINFIFYSRVQRFLVGIIYIFRFILELVGSAMIKGFFGVWQSFGQVPSKTLDWMDEEYPKDFIPLRILSYPILLIIGFTCRYLINIYQLFVNIPQRFIELCDSYFNVQWLKHCFSYQLNLKREKIRDKCNYLIIFPIYTINTIKD